MPFKRRIDSIMSNDRGFELGKNKRVTIRRFKNINLIDIREYYLDQSSGDMRPGKKGISLTEEQYDQLIRHRSEIENCLIDLGSSRSLTDRPEMDSLLEKKQKKDKLKKEKEKEKEKEREKLKKEKELQREKEDRANTMGGIVVPTNVNAVKEEQQDDASDDANTKDEDEAQFETVNTDSIATTTRASTSASSNPRLDDHLGKLPRSAPAVEEEDGDNTMESDLAKALSQDPQNGHSDDDISEAD
ncbi:Sub1 [Kluyveromyces lactis]|nr:Sub1 [Kluyveromyces lactis]